MITTLTQRKRRYLEDVRRRLTDLGHDELEEVMGDLGAHLAELPDDVDPIEAIGTASAFAAEFRATAGIEPDPMRPWRADRLKDHPAVSRIRREWSSFRPTWVAIRGWLGLSAYAALNLAAVFRPFPVPAVSHQELFSLAWLASVSAGSVWIARRAPSHFGWRWADAAFTALVIWGTLAVLVDGIGLVREGQVVEAQQWPLLQTELGPLTNIYAYDREGNPEEVLLYDQDGFPLVVSSSVSVDGRLAYDDYGPIEPATDRYGAPINNLYPIMRLPLESAPPPRVALPAFDDPTTAPTQGDPATGRS